MLKIKNAQNLHIEKVEYKKERKKKYACRYHVMKIPVCFTLFTIYPFTGTNGQEMTIGVRLLSGITTGALSVCLAQPTDVVKIRMQAQTGQGLYNSAFQSYKTIARNEGIRGLWKGKWKFEYILCSFVNVNLKGDEIHLMFQSKRE